MILEMMTLADYDSLRARKLVLIGFPQRVFLSCGIPLSEDIFTADKSVLADKVIKDNLARAPERATKYDFGRNRRQIMVNNGIATINYYGPQ